MSDRRGTIGMMICMATFAALAITSGTTVIMLRTIKKESVYQMRLLQAQAIAEAGAQNALATLRDTPGWTTGFSQKAFKDGYYTVTVSTDKRPWITSAGYSKSLALLGRAFKQVKFRADVLPVPQMMYGVQGRDVDFQGGSYIDSYDSESDPSPSVFGSSATVWANDDLVDMDTSSHTIYGTLTYYDSVCGALSFCEGLSGPSTFVSGAITDSTYTVTLASTPATGWTSDNANSTGLSGTYDLQADLDFIVADGSTATIQSGVYYFKNITINGLLYVQVTDGPVVIFMTGIVDGTNKDGGIVNATKIPGNLIFYGPPTGSAQTNKIDFPYYPLYGLFQSPRDNVTLKSEMYGAILGVDITFSESNYISGTYGRLHQDLSLQRALKYATSPVKGTWTSTYKR